MKDFTSSVLFVFSLTSSEFFWGPILMVDDDAKYVGSQEVTLASVVLLNGMVFIFIDPEKTMAHFIGKFPLSKLSFFALSHTHSKQLNFIY